MGPQIIEFIKLSAINWNFHTAFSFWQKTEKLDYMELFFVSFFVMNWGVFGVELRVFDVELRGFWCWTEGF